VEHQKIAAWVYVTAVVICAFVLGYFVGRFQAAPAQVTVASFAESEQQETLPSVDAAGEETTGVPGCIDLNLAEQSDLETLPGIGPELAARIVAYREEVGQFIAKEQLMDVSGIGEKRYAELEPLITVEVAYEDSGRG